MSEAVAKVNIPKTITDEVSAEVLAEKWSDIRDVIHSIPSYEECLEAMKKAGCKLTVEDIGKPQELFDNCIRYSPFMRYRLTLLRLTGMIN
jgi:glycerol-1-phosphate dehydrogenase [NAD(P)+]